MTSDLTTQGQTSTSVKGKVPQKTASSQTPTTSFGIPRPPPNRTSGNQASHFSTRKTHRTQQITKLNNYILLQQKDMNQKQDETQKGLKYKASTALSSPLMRDNMEYCQAGWFTWVSISKIFTGVSLYRYHWLYHWLCLLLRSHVDIT